jgi:hypothetical protein
MVYRYLTVDDDDGGGGVGLGWGDGDVSLMGDLAFLDVFLLIFHSVAHTNQSSNTFIRPSLSSKGS